MRIRCTLMAAATVLTLVSCGSEPKPKSTQQAVQNTAPAHPPDESNRFPKANLLHTEVVNDHLLDQPFMPGGTLAHYKNGKISYDMFVAKLPTPTDSAILLPDWRRALSNVQPVPSFGGLFGMNSGRPVFVFTKGPWILGIAGLSLQEADAQGRLLAARIS